MLKYLNLNILKRMFPAPVDPNTPENIKKRKRMMAVMAAVVVSGVVIPHYVCITTTASLKSRIYLVNHHPGHVVKKDFVIFPHSNYATHFEIQDLMKQIRCDEGDILEVTSQKEYYCNGEYLGRAKDKSLKGDTIANFVFNGKIPVGKMFVMGHHIDSFDSRYDGMGLLDKSLVKAQGYPVI